MKIMSDPKLLRPEIGRLAHDSVAAPEAPNDDVRLTVRAAIAEALQPVEAVCSSLERTMRRAGEVADRLERSRVR
jgi:hypothetical protein